MACNTALGRSALVGAMASCAGEAAAWWGCSMIDILVLLGLDGRRTSPGCRAAPHHHAPERLQPGYTAALERHRARQIVVWRARIQSSWGGGPGGGRPPPTRSCELTRRGGRGGRPAR